MVFLFKINKETKAIQPISSQFDVCFELGSVLTIKNKQSNTKMVMLTIKRMLIKLNSV